MAFLGVEGDAQGHWILVDFGDVVVHVFSDDIRAYYEIERLYRDARLNWLEEGTPTIQQLVIARNMVRDAQR